jgi:hypothetical protein
MANGTMPMPGAQFPTTANDRLKNSFNDWFWGSLAAAAVIHFLIIAFFPDMQAAGRGDPLHGDPAGGGDAGVRDPAAARADPAAVDPDPLHGREHLRGHHDR